MQKHGCVWIIGVDIVCIRSDAVQQLDEIVGDAFGRQHATPVKE